MGMNGGSQSVVDARVLAWCLAGERLPRGRRCAATTSCRRPTRERGWSWPNRELGAPRRSSPRAAEHGGALPAGSGREYSPRRTEPWPRRRRRQGQTAMRPGPFRIRHQHHSPPPWTPENGTARRPGPDATAP
ncbi:hypothetical protein [Streptomyces clavuligerus]|uniref:hypothetical protein n=1 Tax=Streptomyces clavuligerus TaxID=1901 RepID=UPI001F086AB2|nr:hypothetical protein [Streptomyces clavuligerus]